VVSRSIGRCGSLGFRRNHRLGDRCGLCWVSARHCARPRAALPSGHVTFPSSVPTTAATIATYSAGVRRVATRAVSAMFPYSEVSTVQPAAREPSDAPARRLIAAMVVQAYDDIALGGPVRRAALGWVDERRRERMWSFDWCCEMIGLDPDGVRRHIQCVRGRAASIKRRAARSSAPRKAQAMC